MQIPINTSLAKQNTIQYIQSFQIPNELSLATRETQSFMSPFPPTRRHSSDFSKSHHPEIESVLFASNHLGNQFPDFYSNNSLQFKNTSDINYIDKILYNLPSKRRITRVRFTEASRKANQPSTPPTTSSTANQRSNSQSGTRTASSTRISTPTSPAPSSNVNTPLTASPQIPTYNHIVNKIFSKSLIASLTSKDAVLKEVRDCILLNNESRLKKLRPYIQIY